MKERRRSIGYLARFLAVAACVVDLGAADPINSRWRTEDMKVDGAINEFSVLSSIQTGVSATAANDSDVLQLVVTTSDPSVRQRLMIAGLIVYVDPINKKSEAFGIRVPPLGGPPVPDAPPVDPHLTYVEVIGPAKDERHVVELSEPRGIEGAVGNHEGSLVIELLIPLRARGGWAYAIGLPTGQKVVGLGLVTPDPPLAQSRDGDRGRDSGGRRGRPSGGGGRGGGMPGGRMGRDGEEPSRGNMTGKTVKSWTTIQLASSPSGS